MLGTADDMHERTNTTTPFVDQNQTYSSHPSHQVFLREYVTGADGKLHSTGRLLSSTAADGSQHMATWADVKANALKLGIVLNDTDRSGQHPAARLRCLRQLHPERAAAWRSSSTNVGADGEYGTDDDVTVSGSINPDGSINAITTGAPATSCAPAMRSSTTSPQCRPGQPPGSGFLAADGDSQINGDLNGDGLIGVGESRRRGNSTTSCSNAHYIAGDGRVNENIGLTAVHDIFHAEHNRLIEQIKDADPHGARQRRHVVRRQLGACRAPTSRDGIQDNEWNGERLFQVAKFGTETQYQHLVFEEFARKVAPTIHLFGNNDIHLDPAITSEFANVVYRFGHSMLDENVNRYVSQSGRRHAGASMRNGQPVLNDIGLIEAFTNPLEFADARRQRRRPRSSWARSTRSATRSTSSSPARCATTCSACRSTSPRSTSRAAATPACRRSTCVRNQIFTELNTGGTARHDAEALRELGRVRPVPQARRPR